MGRIFAIVALDTRIPTACFNHVVVKSPRVFLDIWQTNYSEFPVQYRGFLKQYRGFIKQYRGFPKHYMEFPCISPTAECGARSGQYMPATITWWPNVMHQACKLFMFTI